MAPRRGEASEITGIKIEEKETTRAKDFSASPSILLSVSALLRIPESSPLKMQAATRPEVPAGKDGQSVSHIPKHTDMYAQENVAFAGIKFLTGARASFQSKSSHEGPSKEHFSSKSKSRDVANEAISRQDLTPRTLARIHLPENEIRAIQLESGASGMESLMPDTASGHQTVPSLTILQDSGGMIARSELAIPRANTPATTDRIQNFWQDFLEPARSSSEVMQTPRDIQEKGKRGSGDFARTQRVESLKVNSGEIASLPSGRNAQNELAEAKISRSEGIDKQNSKLGSSESQGQKQPINVEVQLAALTSKRQSDVRAPQQSSPKPRLSLEQIRELQAMVSRATRASQMTLQASEARFNWTTSELGTVNFRIESKNQEVTVEVSSARQEVVDAIDQSRLLIERVLSDQGLRLEKFDIQYRCDAKATADERNQDHGHAFNPRERPEGHVLYPSSLSPEQQNPVETLHKHRSLVGSREWVV
jgi:hypothetical protein